MKLQSSSSEKATTSPIWEVSTDISLYDSAVVQLWKLSKTKLIPVIVLWRS
jgi:hypothetical protein